MGRQERGVLTKPDTSNSDHQWAFLVYQLLASPETFRAGLARSRVLISQMTKEVERSHMTGASSSTQLILATVWTTEKRRAMGT